MHIFNFFPTTQPDEHLGLEMNITNKIQVFHDILGEDAKYFSDGEEFGSQELFDILNNKTAYTVENGEGDSELKYLEMIRIIRDEQPNLFKKIKNLSQKSTLRVQKGKTGCRPIGDFFRIGILKKIYINENGKSGEITFKTHFESDTTVGDEDTKGTGGRSNAKYIENRLKEKSFKNFRIFTDSNDEFISGVKEMLLEGTIAKKIAQLIKK